MKAHLFTSLRMSLVTVLVLGLAYPLVVTGVARVLFPYRSRGSMIERDRGVVGSELLGQSFTGSEYFHPRPSASGYDALDSGPTNLAPGSRRLFEDVRGRAERARSRERLSSDEGLPVDMLTSSASGLDPHISPANAEAQVSRVAQARGIPEGRVRTLVARSTSARAAGLFGAERVNVLLLNLALDAEER